MPYMLTYLVSPIFTTNALVEDKNYKLPFHGLGS